MILQVQDLKKSFSQAGTELEVLRGVNLELSEGETIAIIGRSGSGKSTLLSLLAGLDAPTSGRVVLGGTDITAMPEDELAVFRGRSIGIVFQQFHLMGHLTARENILLPLQLLESKEDEHELADTALSRVGLRERASHFPSQLSGGEKQRVAIARALVASPRLLLADEPSGSLDLDTGRSVMELLFSVVRTKKTSMILVTHNEELASQCDRQLLLERGVLRAPA